MQLFAEATIVARHEAARGLAASPAGAAAHPQVHAHEFLTFRLGDEEYGIDIRYVQEIRSCEQSPRIANAPAFIKGVLNLRGVIVPLVDLRLKLGCGSADYNNFTAVVVLNVRGRVVGAVVDSVSDVLELRSKDIRPAAELHSSIDGNFVTGIGTVRHGHGENEAKRMVILMDIEGLMSSPELGLVYA